MRAGRWRSAGTGRPPGTGPGGPAGATGRRGLLRTTGVAPHFQRRPVRRVVAGRYATGPAHPRGVCRARRAGAGESPAADYFVHSAQGMFQPLRPLSGAMFLSLEFFTITTSPMIDRS